MGHVNDPNYYHYHRIVGHPMEKCFISKDLIMKLAKQERIHLDLDEVVESNHATVTFGSFDPVPLNVPPKTLGSCTGDWTLVTQRRPCKKQESHPYPNLPRKEQRKKNIHRHAKKKEEKKPKRKQAIVQVDDLLVQKLITPLP
uniref:Uncharacterized protein n=1 Tax=Vitis vinifera TaxID=29760 RepID=A5AY77_VITVI|nr:hypothetical protein VITISV_032943 [Vitis vinifera]